MCDGVRQYSYLCPHKTVFHQKFMVCDHFLAVDCPGSEKYYGLNAENSESMDLRFLTQKQISYLWSQHLMGWEKF